VKGRYVSPEPVGSGETNKTGVTFRLALQAEIGLVARFSRSPTHCTCRQHSRAFSEEAPIISVEEVGSPK